MIKIIKGPPPSKLLTDEMILINALKIEFDKFPVEYSNGKKTLIITDAYKTDEVKKALRVAQHNKCCFSEAKFVGDYEHVEHFRPKGRLDNWDTGQQTYPGYYWLAYNWKNLFICKQLINVTFKRNFFPLRDETKRNRDHHQVNKESPILIDPAVDDPRKHIQFHKDEPIHKTKRGRVTIELLGLRHSHFEEDRRKYFSILQGFKNIVDVGIAEGLVISSPIFAFSLNFLRKAILPDAKFSSMAIDLLSGWPHI